MIEEQNGGCWSAWKIGDHERFIRIETKNPIQAMNTWELRPFSVMVLDNRTPPDGEVLMGVIIRMRFRQRD